MTEEMQNRLQLPNPNGQQSNSKTKSFFQEKIKKQFNWFLSWKSILMVT